jgi:hypothetical protein
VPTYLGLVNVIGCFLSLLFSFSKAGGQFQIFTSFIPEYSSNHFVVLEWIPESCKQTSLSFYGK